MNPKKRNQPMQQNRLTSLIEVSINVFLGYWVALALQIIIFPLYGFDITLAQNIQISALFTGAAVIRGYFVRRFFNSKIHAIAVAVAARRKPAKASTQPKAAP